MIRQKRGDANRLGFAVQLCYFRFPGIVLDASREPSSVILKWVSSRLGIDEEKWGEYGKREQTRREHLSELCDKFEYKMFNRDHYRVALRMLTESAMENDRGIALATKLIESLRKKSIILPAMGTIDRACGEAMARANRTVFSMMTDSLTDEHRKGLDGLLDPREGMNVSRLAWLRQEAMTPNSRRILEHIDRLKYWKSLNLPKGLGENINRNRLLRIAREGARMQVGDFSKFEPKRRYATLAALAVESMESITDEILLLNDKIIGKIHNAAKSKHQREFQDAGKSINEKVRLYGKVGRAILAAKESNGDPFAAIRAIMTWEEFEESVDEAEVLARPEDFDHLHLIKDGYMTLRRYILSFLETLDFRETAASPQLMEATRILRDVFAGKIKEIPADAPTGFVKKRWANLVLTPEGIDKKHYALCVASEMRTAIRSGDVWVSGSRQFKDFGDYLLPEKQYTELKGTGELSLAITPSVEEHLRGRFALLKMRLETVNRLAAAGKLPDAVITETGLKVSPLESGVPDAAQGMIEKAARLMPRVKITDLLMEVNAWTNFTRHFRHMKTDATAGDDSELMTVILADAINLGLWKMAECCPGSTYQELSWLHSWHVRDETYSAALAELTNSQYRQPLALVWGDGTTSSSDGQRFRAGSRAESSGHTNPKYGSEPGRMFYTHVSDQYSPFSSKVINVGVRDSTYVLDGLLQHESDLRIEEHYTDTLGFTDHVFALMNILGFRFAPRIRDLHETKIYVPPGTGELGTLDEMIGGTINTKVIETNWDDVLRLAASIKQGSCSASLVLQKLGGYPRQNGGLAQALRELGRIERSLFILDWLQDGELRRRVNAGLNKGEARNALARAVFFNRLGEIRDRTFEQQRHRASGLTLVTAAIVLWNTVYLQRVVEYLKATDPSFDPLLVKHMSPLGWEHINLAGDYSWRSDARVNSGRLRELNASTELISPKFRHGEVRQELLVS